MGSLRFANKNDINYHEYRDKLYYNKYKYKLIISFETLRFFTYSNYNLKHWETNVRKKLSGNTLVTTLNFKDRLLNMRDLIKKQNIRQRIEGDKISLFFNDINELTDFKSNFPASFPITTYESIVSNEPKVKFFMRKPKFKFRAYMKTKRVTIQEKKELEDFLENASFELKLSSSLSRWFKLSRSSFLFSNFYFDFNDELAQTYLALSMSDYIEKYYICKQADISQS
jgi:uncharacterized membrane protein